MYNPKVESLQNYFDNDILISDWSGAAFEFAFGTLKPAIFLDLPKKVNNENYLDLSNRPIEIKLRSKIGKIINKNNYRKIPEIINDFKKNKDIWKKKIMLARKSSIYNINTSGNVGADYISELIKKN